MNVTKSLLLVIAIVISVSASAGTVLPCRDFLATRLTRLTRSIKESDPLYFALREKMAHKLEGVLYIHNSGIEFYGSFQRSGPDLRIMGVSLEVRDGQWSQRRTAVFVAAFFRVLKDEVDSGRAKTVAITATEIQNPLFAKMLRAYGFQEGPSGDTVVLKLDAGQG